MARVTVAAALAALLVCLALAQGGGAVSLREGKDAALVEEEGKLWFHLDNLLAEGNGAQARDGGDSGDDEDESVGEEKDVAVKDKKGGSTTVLANKNFMSIMEDAKGRELSPHLAAAEARLEAHEAAQKRELEAFKKRNAEANKKHLQLVKHKQAYKQKAIEAQNAKKNAIEEVAKAKGKADEINKKTAELRKKMAAAEAAKAKQAWRFEKGWANLGSSYNDVTAKKEGGYCYLDGVAKGKGSVIGWVPEQCRPGGRIMFALKQGNSNTATARVDILPDGRVFLVHTTGAGWISLSGVYYALASEGTTGGLSIRNNWVNFGGSWRPTRLTRTDDGLCTLSGLIKSGKWNHFMVLPASCRPSKKLMFAASNHETYTRVVVDPNSGWVHRNGGGAKHGWVSMDGIRFVAGSNPGTRLTMYSPWSHYDEKNTWGPAVYKRVGDSCVLSGLVKTTNWNSKQIARLPTGCRPSRRLIFNAVASDRVARVDVLPNGVVYYITGRQSGNWLSLSNVQFVAKQ